MFRFFLHFYQGDYYTPLIFVVYRAYEACFYTSWYFYHHYSSHVGMRTLSYLFSSRFKLNFTTNTDEYRYKQFVFT